MVEYAQLTPGFRGLCIREVQRSLKQSSKLLIEDKILEFELEGSRRDQFRVMNDEIRTPYGGVIVFQGMREQSKESVKSFEAFDVAWVEEAQSLSQNSLNLLRPTIRKNRSELWFSWNPRSAKDPVDQLLRGSKLPERTTVVRANYEDNPWFPEALREEMEYDRGRDVDKYLHVWVGEYERHSEARVFHNWRIDEFETPHDAFFKFGADWGYSKDPTVLIRGFEGASSGIRKTLFIDREVWKIGCSIDHTPKLFDGIDPTRERFARDWLITADNARPETIDYMRRNGYPRMMPAKKGPNSVVEGVEFLKSYDIVVHPRCKHVIDELESYKYKVDPHTNEVSPYLEDKKNHTIDSIRYMMEGRQAVSGEAVGVALSTSDVSLRDHEQVSAGYDGGLT
jgi:phage terminase large subunit